VIVRRTGLSSGIGPSFSFVMVSLIGWHKAAARCLG
jgi:hypothetical protein